MLEQTSLLCFTVSLRTNDLSDNIKEALKERLQSCAALRLALDESTDISDTAQLVMFNMAATVGFDVVEESLDMASLFSTTTGQDICEHAIRVMEKIERNPAKLCGLTTDGTPSMTDRTNGLTKKSMDVIEVQDLKKSLQYSPRGLVYQSFGICSNNEKYCPVYKLHQSMKIKSSAIQSIYGIP